MGGINGSIPIYTREMGARYIGIETTGEIETIWYGVEGVAEGGGRGGYSLYSLYSLYSPFRP